MRINNVGSTDGDWSYPTHRRHNYYWFGRGQTPMRKSLKVTITGTNIATTNRYSENIHRMHF